MPTSYYFLLTQGELMKTFSNNTQTHKHPQHAGGGGIISLNAPSQSTLDSISKPTQSTTTPSLRGSETTKAIQNFASAKYNQINSTREACNLESVVGGLGGQRGDKGGDFACRRSQTRYTQIQAPLSPP